MSGTALAVAIDALIAAYTPPAATAGVTMIDGEPKDPPPKHLCVGWDAEGDAATSRPRPNDAAGATVDDTVQIGCWLSFWHGTDSVSQIRAAAVAAYSVLDAALRADPQLGDTAMDSSSGDLAYLVDRVSREGTIVVLRWTVTVRAIA